ncbi:unnamed protein product [Musa acuminata subsp. burmannicoides]
MANRKKSSRHSTRRYIRLADTSRLRVRSTAEELVVDYSPTGRRTPSWPKLSPRRSRHRAGIFSADRRGLFCGAPQDRADRVDRTAAPFWLQQGKNSSSPSSTARDGGGQKELSSFKDGRRKNSGGQCMNTRCILHLRDTSSLSREEDLVSTHLRRQLQKTVESTFTEAARETLTGGSFRWAEEKERNLLLLISSTQEVLPGMVAHPNGAFHPTSHHLQPRWCNSSYWLPS